MPIRSLNHIGIAVRSIAEQRVFYEDVLGLRYEGEEDIPSQQVRVAFFRVGEIRIELLEATSSASPVARFISQRGEGVHHLAYEVDDLAARISQLQQAGLRMIDEQPTRGSHDLSIAFIHPKSTYGVLTELCESSDS